MLDNKLFVAAYQKLYDEFTDKRKLSPDEGTVWSSAEDKEFQAAYLELLKTFGRIPFGERLLSMPAVSKAIKPEVAIEPNIGVPSSLEVARALSRLEILPNPDDPALGNIEKYVESPWQTLPTPSVDPNVWDDARVTLINLAELFGTDPYLKRKRVAKHVEAMGQALTPRRSYAMLIELGGKKIIVDGHHRLMALWLLGLEEAPVWLVKE
jgi:hypothetical protein